MACPAPYNPGVSAANQGLSRPEEDSAEAVDRPSRVGVVPRARLTDRLLLSPPVTLVVLAAPAGYSKTTTLKAWAEADRRPVAWVSCDWRHNDPAVFLQSIAAALSAVRPISDETVTVLGIEAAWPETALARLASALEVEGSDFALVIDDAHLLTSADSVSLLSGLCDALPQVGQLVIGSRRTPPLPLGRMRANRNLLELGVQDLKMTRRESRQLLSLAGLELDDRQAEIIHERTEGWPAALQLGALALADREDIDEAVAAFAGDDRVVVDYLHEEFLSVTDPGLVRFMTRTSALNTLSGPLCDAALQTKGSAALLKDLSLSNALVIPLDRNNSTYRYHHLFADMLRSDLKRFEPEVVPGIHARASAWYESRGKIEQAVEHAILSGDTCLSGRLIWTSLPEMSGRGRMATLTRWLDDVGQDRLTESHGLMLAAAHAHLVMGSGERAGYWLALAESTKQRPDCTLPVESDLYMLKATYPTRGIAGMEEDAKMVRQLKPPDDVWQGAAIFYEGVAASLGGDTGTGSELLREAARLTALTSPIIQCLALSQLALTALDEKDLEPARRLVSQAEGQVSRCGIAEYPSMVLVSAAGAAVKSAAGLPEKARESLETGLRLLARLNSFLPWYETEARVALAEAAVRLQDFETAVRLADEARVHFELTSDASVLEGRLERLESSLRKPDREAGAAASSLTRAELRTLQYLPTHLTFRQIGELNSVSANTVKTQARAIYNKLGVGSRAEAVERARKDGLFEEDQVKMI
jgi:LuxR family maltose regulon positive regulatory protein